MKLKKIDKDLTVAQRDLHRDIVEKCKLGNEKIIGKGSLDVHVSVSGSGNVIHQ